MSRHGNTGSHRRHDGQGHDESHLGYGTGHDPAQAVAGASTYRVPDVAVTGTVYPAVTAMPSYADYPSASGPSYFPPLYMDDLATTMAMSMALPAQQVTAMYSAYDPPAGTFVFTQPQDDATVSFLSPFSPVSASTASCGIPPAAPQGTPVAGPDAASAELSGSPESSPHSKSKRKMKNKKAPQGGGSIRQDDSGRRHSRKQAKHGSAAGPAAAAAQPTRSGGNQLPVILPSPVLIGPAAVDPPAGHVPQLRTASRAPKRTGPASAAARRPEGPPEAERQRAMHNEAELNYRQRLNNTYSALLSTLPDEGSAVGGDRKISKVQVLDRATRRIYALEDEEKELERRHAELAAKLADMEAHCKDWDSVKQHGGNGGGGGGGDGDGGPPPMSGGTGGGYGTGVGATV